MLSDVIESECVSVADNVRSLVKVFVVERSGVPVSVSVPDNVPDSDTVNVCVCDKVLSGERVNV